MRHILAVSILFTACITATGQEIYFQAHRGGLNEVPENTMLAMTYAWDIAGAVPEIDVRTTADGVLIGLHDSTLERTTDAGGGFAMTPVNELTYEEIADLDAGSYFNVRFADARIPTIDAVLEEMAKDPKRRIYLDLKDAELSAVKDLITKHDVMDRVIFVHGDPGVCLEIHEYFDGAPVMTWISGSERGARRKFAQHVQREFEGIGQIQFHLRGKQTEDGIVYDLDEAYLREAISIAESFNIEFQVRPFVFDAKSLRGLIDLGIHWYVSDNPKAFRAAVEEALALEPTE